MSDITKRGLDLARHVDYPDSFLRHAATCTSQYDASHRALYGHVLALHQWVVEACAALAERPAVPESALDGVKHEGTLIRAHALLSSAGFGGVYVDERVGFAVEELKRLRVDLDEIEQAVDSYDDGSGDRSTVEAIHWIADASARIPPLDGTPDERHAAIVARALDLASVDPAASDDPGLIELVRQARALICQGCKGCGRDSSGASECQWCGGDALRPSPEAERGALAEIDAAVNAQMDALGDAVKARARRLEEQDRD